MTGQDPDASPSARPEGSNAWRGSASYAVFLLMAAMAFAFRYVFWVPEYINLPAYVHGQERLPFQARILTAWLVRAAVDAPGLGRVFHHIPSNLPPNARAPEFLALALVDFVAMVLAVLAVRAMLRRCGVDRAFASWSALLVIYMSYFNVVLGYGLDAQPYDVVALAFMAAGVFCVMAGHLWWMLPLVLAGSFNRETVIFLPLFLVLYNVCKRPADRQPWPPVLASAVLQTLLIAAVRIWLRHLLRDSPVSDAPVAGGLLSVHLAANLRALLKPQFWPLFLSIFGFALVPFVAGFRSIPDRALAKASAIVLALWIALMLVVGVVTEVRIFNELTGWVAPCVALVIWNHWKCGPAQRTVTARRIA